MGSSERMPPGTPRAVWDGAARSGEASLPRPSGRALGTDQVEDRRRACSGIRAPDRRRSVDPADTPDYRAPVLRRGTRRRAQLGGRRRQLLLLPLARPLRRPADQRQRHEHRRPLARVGGERRGLPPRALEARPLVRRLDERDQPDRRRSRCLAPAPYPPGYLRPSGPLSPRRGDAALRGQSGGHAPAARWSRPRSSALAHERPRPLGLPARRGRLRRLLRRRDRHPDARGARDDGVGQHPRDERAEDPAGDLHQRRGGPDVRPCRSRRLATGLADARRRDHRGLRLRVVRSEDRPEIRAHLRDRGRHGDDDLLPRPGSEAAPRSQSSRSLREQQAGMQRLLLAESPILTLEAGGPSRGRPPRAEWV